MTEIHLDFETSGTVSVVDVGAWAYSMHPDTRAECAYYRVDDGEPRPWLPGMGFPTVMEIGLRNGAVFAAHNAMFEVAIWTNVMPIYGWPAPPLFERWVDSMASAAHKSVPMALDDACAVLQLPHQKAKTGKPLLNRMHLPLDDPNRSLTDAERETLWAYNRDDVLAESDLLHALGPLPPGEQRMWVLNQKINARGLQIDVGAAFGAIEIADRVAYRLNDRIEEITKGRIERASERDKILKWSEEQGYKLPNLTAETVDAELMHPGDGMPPAVHEVLTIRRSLAKSSVAKYRKMIQCMGPDQRVRGALQYHGAHTGREAGRLIQPQNFTRPSDENLDFEQLIAIIKLADPDILEAIYGEPLVALADGLRPTITCAQGNKLVGGDFSAIEAIITAWLAGEDWKLDAFRRIFRGEKYGGADDIYCATAAKILGMTVTKKDNPQERQIGKTCELAFGFGGGLYAYLNFDSSGRFSNDEIQEFKRGWRREHPMTTRFWKGLEHAAIEAFLNPGREISFRSIGFQMVGAWLTAILPSGRRLWYYGPFVRMEPLPWLDETGEKQAEGPKLFYRGRTSKGWQIEGTYGGKLTENVVQAVARDLMVHSMHQAEAESIPIVLTVHDELLAEVNGSRADAAATMRQCLEDLPSWGETVPMSAPTWEGIRWRK